MAAVGDAGSVTEEDANEAISSLFATTWPTLQPAVPFGIENEQAGLPLTLPPTSDRFALLEILPTTSNNATMGEAPERLVERNGWIQVKLWVPAGERTRGARQLEKSVRDIFEMTDIGVAGADGETIDTFASSTQPVGNDGRWYMTLVRTPYTFYETK